MPNCLNPMRQVIQATQIVMMRVAQLMRSVRMRLRSHTALAAEHLFLQQQLALYEERTPTWRRDMHATRFTLVMLSYWFDWEPALTIVQPETFKRWRRQGWRLLWTKPAKLGRPPIPPELQALIRRMARENLTWGQQRIANELLLKLGLRVSPRTVRKYMPRDCVGSPGRRCPSQRWSTFIRNHAKGLIVTGVTAEVAQRAQDVFASLRRCVQRRRARKLPRASRPVTPHDNGIMVHPNDASAMAGIAPVDWVTDMRHVERSPPEGRLSRNRASVPVVQARSVAKGDVRSVHPVRCRRDFAYAEAQGVTSALNGVIRCDARPRAA